MSDTIISNIDLEIYFLKNYDKIIKISNKPAIVCWKTGVLENASGKLINFEKNTNSIIRNDEYDYSVFVPPLKSNNKKTSLKQIVKKLICKKAETSRNG
jgi:hypothetical protein